MSSGSRGAAIAGCAVAALLALAGCAATGSPPASASVAAVPSLPSCAPAGSRVDLPAELDGVLPLPLGTAITSSDLTGQGPLIIGGYVPAQLADASAFFREQLPKAGFELGEGDAEGDEAEQAFSGHGLEGQWKVHSILGCPDAVSLTIAVSGTPT